MIGPNPNEWSTEVWGLLGSAAVLSYIVRLVDKINNKKVKSVVIEVLEFCICVGIAFGVFLVSTFFSLDDRLVWLFSVYLGHRGTRYIFSRMDLVTESYLKKLTGDQHVKDSDSDQP